MVSKSHAGNIAVAQVEERTSVPFSLATGSSAPSSPALSYLSAMARGELSQPEKDGLLLDAAAVGCFDEVKSLVNQGSNPCYGNHRALRIAASSGHVEVVQTLISKHTADDAELFHEALDQALCNAAQGGYPDLVNLLLEVNPRSPQAIQQALEQARQCISQSTGVFGSRRATPPNGHDAAIGLLTARVSGAVAGSYMEATTA